MRMGHFFDDLVVVPFRRDQPSVQVSAVQEVLDDVCLKCAEDISGTEMDPKWILFCFFRNFCTVKAGEAVPCGFPLFTVFQTIFI